MRQFEISGARRQGGVRQSLRGVRALALASVAIGGLMLASCGPKTPQAAAAGPAPVTVSAPLVQNLAAAQDYTGQFAARDQVEIRAQVGGTLNQIAFQDGALVQKGQLLFVIDPVPYEIKLAQGNAQLASAQARLDLTDRDLKRAQTLQKAGAASVEILDQRIADQKSALAAVEAARAQVRDARFDLDHTRISAPFTGRIGSHQVSVGNLVSGSRGGASPTTLLTTLVSMDPIYLSFEMSEADYLAFKRAKGVNPGRLADRVSVQLSDEASQTRTGVLDFVDNSLDRGSGTVHARATIDNSDLLATPGAFGRVRVSGGVIRPTLLVPDAAVLPDQANHVVMTVGADGAVTAKKVELGEVQDGLRVIRSGLAPSDRVIIEGAAMVQPGAKVSPKSGVIRPASAQAKN